ncbi:ABC transporter permease [Pseudoalteromonas luteoviolacea]|uniref:ABC3 transporter permease protein domain-containing protein n=1 Tax=Pseudoalteromonas luteoviolacea H33 TaxID=1365251 RepID=A0A161XZA4_9GAMM|nr:ABC transporter permease [Pseudoalteromonas luteoviolacea]KZN48739.1 hypothetical protein N476_21225 [Pseudoalteromonas luteoviolacea H33]KZN75426.1 hypothetical protein N477_01560 [Pseudoalteromonas luteoviolacea H33-S]
MMGIKISPYYLKLAARSLLKSPSFLTTTVLSLTLSLTILFVTLGVVSSYFIKPMNVKHESQLRVVKQKTITESGESVGQQSYPLYKYWYKQNNSFDSLFLYASGAFILTSQPEEPKVTASYVTQAYFDIMQVPVILGASFDPNVSLVEHDSGEVVISEALWESEFDRDPQVIGKTIGTLEKSFRIIGVVAQSYAPPLIFDQGRADIWLPFSALPDYESTDWSDTSSNLLLVGVLGAQSAENAAYTALHQVATEMTPEWKNTLPDAQDIQPYIVSYREAELGEHQQHLLLVVSLVSLLLFVATVNIANMFVSRSVSKSRVANLQVALGAKKSTIFAMIFAEPLVVMGISLLLSLSLALLGMEAVRQFAQGYIPLTESLAIDHYVVLFALLICLLLAYIFAVVTTRSIDFSNIAAAIQSSGKGSVTQVSNLTIKLLLGFQMCMVTCIVILSATVLSDALDSVNTDVGMEVDNIVSVPGMIPGDRAPLTEKYDKFQRVKQAFLDLPQVEDVAYGWSPMTPYEAKIVLTDSNGLNSEPVSIAYIGENYLNLTGVRILEGRDFSYEAYTRQAREVIVSRSMAMSLDKDGSVVGKVYTIRGQEVEVVGVSTDFNHPKFYKQNGGKFAWTPLPPAGFPLVLKLQEGTSISKEEALRTFRGVYPRITMWVLSSFEKDYDNFTYIRDISLWISAFILIFTTSLACIGIYGIANYYVSLQRHKYAIYKALGAKPRLLYRSFAKEVLPPLLVGVGIAIGLTSLLGTRLFSSTDAPADNLMLVASVVVAGTLFMAVSSSFLSARGAFSKSAAVLLRAN